MNKRMLILVVGIFLVNLIPVSSYFYTINHSCVNGFCIEGQNAEWQVKIFNKGANAMEYTSIELFDSVNDSLIAAYYSGFKPLSVDRGDTIIVNSGRDALVVLNSTLPPANKGNDLLYYACFTTATPNDDWTHRQKNIYEIKNCYDSNESMTVFQCISNNYCSKDEACSHYECIKLNCNECQYASNHTCRGYECCDSNHCKINESCVNNSCIRLNCQEDEYLEDHACKKSNCTYDELIVNNACIKLNCSFDEFAFNHACNKLNCSDNEYIKDHKCKTLECAENEYAGNHGCNQLKCDFNETFSSHTCVPLDCVFFKRIHNHRCVADKQFIYKLLAEITALFLIITFLILDMRKYESKHKKQLNKKFYK